MNRHNTLAALGLFVALSTSACAGAFTGSQAQDPRPTPAASPDPQLRDLESKVFTDWEFVPDMDELRATFGARDDFAVACELERPLRETFRALETENWDEMMRLATHHLGSCPVDIDFHLFRAIALEKRGRPAEALQHHHWRRALLESVLDSGDGRTAKTAWVVISVSEEYSVMRALGMHLKHQVFIAGHIDGMTVEVKGKPDQSIYFNPAAHFVRLKKQLE